MIRNPRAYVIGAAIVVLALVLGSMGVEAALRGMGFKPREARVNRFFVPGKDTSWSLPDPELGWINKPGTSRALEGDHVSMTFWDFSRRASRLDATPAAGKIPVMVIGGSNAQAYGVRDEESFVWLLAQRFPDLWFENFGTGGYGTVQAAMLAARAYDRFYPASAKPRLILLGFDDSHMLRNVADHSWIFSISDSQGRYVAPPHDRLHHGKLAFVPFRTIGFWPLERESSALTILHDAWIREHYATAAEALPVSRMIVDRLNTFATEHGAQFAVAMLEDRSDAARKLFGDASFPFIDCSGNERADPAHYMLDGGHPNARAHAYFADCIGDWLKAAALTGSRAPEAPTHVDAGR